MYADRRLAFRALLTLLAVVPQVCRAVVTWTTIECNGVNIQGSDINALWDNAALMANNAGDVIEALTGGLPINAGTSSSRIADNAKWMFGITYAFAKILPSSSKSVLTGTVSTVYSNAKSMLQTNNGFLICGGTTAQKGTFGSFIDVWYYTIPGTQDALLIPSQPSNVAPCSDATQLGQTFRGTVQPAGGGATSPALGVLFCVDQINARGYKGVLTSGYTADQPQARFPDPNQYRSAAGTLLHEMIHCTDPDTYEDLTYPDIFPDTERVYGYNRCATLAQSDQDAALINPDNFRVFAEMAMTPATRWGMPVIGGGTGPPPAKRGLAARDEPRMSIGERRAAASSSMGQSVPDAFLLKGANDLGWWAQ